MDTLPCRQRKTRQRQALKIVLQPHWGSACGIAVLPILLLTGCRIGPDYQPPNQKPAADWVEPARLESDRFAQGVEVDPAWWTELGDPLLGEIIRTAIKENHDLQIARQRVQKARRLIGVAESGLLPHIGVSASSTQIEFSENFPVLESFFDRGQADPRQELFSAGFDAAWELDFFGGTRRRAEAAEARAEAAEEMRRGAVLTVVAEVAATYVDLQAARQQADIVLRQMELSDERIDLVRAGIASDVQSELDLTGALARRKALEARLPILRAAEAAAVYRMAVLTGREPSRMLDQLADTPPLPSLPDVVPVGLPGDMLRRRPDVAQAERALAAATAEIGAAAALLYPSFSLTGMAGRQGGAFTDLYQSASGTWMIVPGIRWPLFQGGRIRAEVDAAEDAREAARLAYRRAILQAVSGVEAALSRYARAFESRERLQGVFVHQQRAVTLADDGVRAGVFSRLDLIAAREKLLQTDRKLIQSRAAVMRALIRLNKELGGGWDFSGGPQAAASLSR